MFSLLTPVAAPVAVRSFNPTYASFASSTSSADDQPRRAIKAATTPASLLKHLHRMTGSLDDPIEDALDVGASACVKVVGWQVVESTAAGKALAGSHVAYTILAASASDTKFILSEAAPLSEARIVQRRFRDFDKLAQALRLHSKDAVPSLPPKLTYGLSVEAVAKQRQAALHEWLTCVVRQPLLWQAEELRSFLGLPPTQSGDGADEMTDIMDSGSEQLTEPVSPDYIEDYTDADKQATSYSTSYSTSWAPRRHVEQLQQEELLAWFSSLQEEPSPCAAAARELASPETWHADDVLDYWADLCESMDEELMAPQTRPPRRGETPMRMVVEASPCGGAYVVDLAALEAKAVELYMME